MLLLRWAAAGVDLLPPAPAPWDASSVPVEYLSALKRGSSSRGSSSRHSPSLSGERWIFIMRTLLRRVTS